MPIPVKLEIFKNDDDEAMNTYYYEHFRVCDLSGKEEFLQKVVGVYKDFPDGIALAEHFISKGRDFYSKLYLDEDGHIITRVKISKCGEMRKKYKY